MSIESYREKVRRQISNGGTPTCFPAALEQVSPYHSLPSRVYGEFKDYVKFIKTIPGPEQNHYVDEHMEMREKLVRPLGGLAFEDIVFKRATTPVGFAREVGKLLREEFRVVADVTYTGSPYDSHSVGILPTKEKNYVTLVSNHVPKCLQGIVTLHKIGEHLALGAPPFSKIHPWLEANIIALPEVI